MWEVENNLLCMWTDWGSERAAKLTKIIWAENKAGHRAQIAITSSLFSLQPDQRKTEQVVFLSWRVCLHHFSHIHFYFWSATMHPIEIWDKSGKKNLYTNRGEVTWMLWTISDPLGIIYPALHAWFPPSFLISHQAVFLHKLAFPFNQVISINSTLHTNIFFI